MSQPPIVLVPYDPSWPVKFEEEKKIIESTIGEFINDREAYTDAKEQFVKAIVAKAS